MLGQLKVYPHGFLVEPTHFGLVNCCGSSMMITTAAAARKDNNIAEGSFGYCNYNTAQFRPSFLTNLSVFRILYGLEAIIFSEFYWLKATEIFRNIGIYVKNKVYSYCILLLWCWKNAHDIGKPYMSIIML